MSLQKVFLKGLFSTLEFVGVVLVFSEESCWVESRALQKPISECSIIPIEECVSLCGEIDDGAMGGLGARRTQFAAM